MPAGMTLSEAFERDLERYLARLGSEDPFDADAPSRKRAEATIKHRRLQLKRVAADLIASGMPANDLIDLATLVQPESVKPGLRHMRTRQGDAVSSTMWILVSVLTGIARNYVKLPEPELKKLQDLRRRLVPRQRGTTAKNRRRAPRVWRARRFLRKRHRRCQHRDRRKGPQAWLSSGSTTSSPV